MREGAALPLRVAQQTAAWQVRSLQTAARRGAGGARLGELLVAEEDEEGDAAVLRVRQPLAQVVLLLQPSHRKKKQAMMWWTHAGLPLCLATHARSATLSTDIIWRAAAHRALHPAAGWLRSGAGHRMPSAATPFHDGGPALRASSGGRRCGALRAHPYSTASPAAVSSAASSMRSSCSSRRPAEATSTCSCAPPLE